MAKVTGAELLRLLRAEADRVADIADRLRDAVEVVVYGRLKQHGEAA